MFVPNGKTDIRKSRFGFLRSHLDSEKLAERKVNATRVRLTTTTEWMKKKKRKNWTSECNLYINLMSYSCSHKYFPDLQLFTMMIYIGAFASSCEKRRDLASLYALGKRLKKGKPVGFSRALGDLMKRNVSENEKRNSTHSQTQQKRTK